MPATIASPSAASSLLMTFPRCRSFRTASVNFGRPRQRLFQLFKGESGAAGNFENWRLTAAAEIGRVRHFRSDVERDNHGTVTVGMDEVFGAHAHSGDAD